MTTEVRPDIKRLFENSLLRHYPHCPVCGQGKRSSVNKRPYYDHYSKAISKTLGLPEVMLMEILCTYRCLNCQTIYCDPWLTSTSASKLYGTHYPQHELGWRDFYKWAANTPPTYGPQFSQKVWDLLIRICGPIDTYGQINCPLYGLLTFFKDQDLHGQSKNKFLARQWRDLQKPLLHPRSIYTLPNRLARLMIKLKGKFIAKSRSNEQGNINNLNIWPLRKVTRALSFPDYRQKNHSESVHHNKTFPKDKYLVYCYSSVFWSINCQSLGLSCRSVGQGALCATTINFDDARKDNIHFDLLCFFNSLDHFFEPKKVLEEALSVSKFVLIEVHKSDDRLSFSRQHLYAFGENFLESIKDPSWSAINITAQLTEGGQQNYYLVSKDKQLTI